MYTKKANFAIFRFEAHITNSGVAFIIMWRVEVVVLISHVEDETGADGSHTMTSGYAVVYRMIVGGRQFQVRMGSRLLLTSLCDTKHLPIIFRDLDLWQGCHFSITSSEWAMAFGPLPI